MRIAAIQPTTLLDYPNQVAAIVFTWGCVFRCGYCHNPELVCQSPAQELSMEAVLDFFTSRVGLLDGVVITGGEPTIYPDLPEFIRAIKKLGFLVKLDTNGTNPEMLASLFSEKLLDYVAMDIKAPLVNYAIAVGRPVDATKIERSIKLIMASGVGYEFRSTILPRLHTTDDIIAMAKLIAGAPRFYLQTFRDSGKLVDVSFHGEKSFSAEEMEQLAATAGEFVEVCEVR